MEISIICPVYNKEKFIIDTIRSVESQTSSCWELILVDDGSTDDSLKLIEEYLNLSKFSIYLYQRQDFSNIKGANSCRNIGANLAKNNLLLFLDADDILLESCIENRLKEISRYPKSNFFIFGVAYALGNPPNAYDKLNVSKSTSKAIKNRRDLQDEFLKQFLSFEFPWHTSGPIWNKLFFERIGGFNIELQRLQDPEIHIRALISDYMQMEFLTPSYGYDILHRKDDDRQIFDEHTFFIKQIDSVSKFVLTIVQLLNKSNKTTFSKYLIHYLIFAETICYKLIRDNSYQRRKDYFKILDALYTSNSFLPLPKFYLFCVKRIIRPLESSKIILKKKIPGALLLLIKQMYL